MKRRFFDARMLAGHPRPAAAAPRRLSIPAPRTQGAAEGNPNLGFAPIRDFWSQPLGTSELPSPASPES